MKTLFFKLFMLSASLSTLIASGPAPRMEERRFEIMFMGDMSDHHAGGVMMGETCEQKATHQELKDMCHEMVKLQSQEIAQMKGWLSNWYGISYEARVRPESMKEMEELNKLSGAAYEVMFMKMLVRHHAGAIKMSADCLHMSHHRELDELCHKIIENQLKEIKDLKRWLCEWYQICEDQNHEDEGLMEMSPQRTGTGTVSFSFLTEIDKTYAVEAKPSITANEWALVQETTGTSGVQTFQDTNATAQQRFFRLKATER